MRVELDVDLRPARSEPSPKPVVDPEFTAEKRRRRRTEQFLRRVALARVIEAAIRSGDFEDLAKLARQCRVSRALVSKAVGWHWTSTGPAAGSSERISFPPDRSCERKPGLPLVGILVPEVEELANDRLADFLRTPSLSAYCSVHLQAPRMPIIDA
jgi:hypothetical protein